MFCVRVSVFPAASHSSAESTEKNRASVEHGRNFDSLGWASQHCYCNARTTCRLHRTG